MPTKEEILTQAFQQLGTEPSDPTFTIPNPDPLIAAALAAYDTLLTEMLGGHPWSFAMVIADLVLSIDPSPLPELFQFVYKLPSDMEKFVTFFPLNLDYERIKPNLVLSGFDDLKIVYVSTVDETLFPSYFTSMMIAGIASKLALLITQNTDIKQIRNQIFESQLALARNRDSQFGPSRIFADMPLIRAHTFSGRVGR